MPDSPFLKAGHILDIQVFADGKPAPDELNLASIEVERALYQIPTATLVFILSADVGDNQALTILYPPGAEIEIKAGYGRQAKNTIFKGILVNQGIRSRHDAGYEMVLYCMDKAFRLTGGRKSRYYRDMSDSDIAGAVATDNGLEHDVEATADLHREVVQYQSTDWDFMLIRAAANGLFVYAEDGKIYLKKPLSSGEPELERTIGRDVLAYDLQMETRFQIPSASRSAWDMKTQAMAEASSTEPARNNLGNLIPKDLGTKIGLMESRMATSAPLASTELKAWADAELLHARMSLFQGTLTFLGSAKARLNTFIRLIGFGDRFSGNALITGVRHSIRKGEWLTTVSLGTSPENPVEAASATLTPSLHAGLLPPIAGLQIGVVKQIDADPDGEHRVLVQVPAITYNGEGIWARMAHFYATSGKGAFFLPETGDEVTLGFLNDDPRFPVILGTLYSSKHKPPYTAEAENKIKAIVTKNDLKIEFNDADKVLAIQTPGGNRFILSDKDKSIQLRDQNGNTVELNAGGITLRSPKDLSLLAQGNINLVANTGISASSVQGNLLLAGLNVEAKASVAFSAQGTAQAELHSAGQTSVKGAMVMIN